MKILVLGASGFIGRHIVEGLGGDGYEVVGKWYDFLQESCVEEWKSRVKGFDVVINAVGIIAESQNKTFQALHTDTPKAIFQACSEAGVKRVIQISALGAEEGAVTLYHQSKKAADDYLKSLDISYAILKPSIVYGEEGKSTALFKALANLPFLPIIDDGTQKLQPIYIDDLVAAVLKVLQSDSKQIELNLVGKEPLTYQELLKKFRAWLGKKPTKSIKIPAALAIFGKVLDEPTISKDNLTMLRQGNAADVTPLKDFLGTMPKSMDEAIFATQATKNQKLVTDLCFIRPLLRIIIAFVWIWSGVTSAFLYPQEEALALLADVGITGDLALPMLYFASFLDIGIGVFLLLGVHVVCLLWLSLIVITGYTLILTLLAPFHWLHPFGPVLKNLPLLVAIYVAIALERAK
ncbi:MAG: NAD-dependent epimerase/dehydratase family protein [Campylobacterales bacterium]|nr:NAD-dependent epimerase/dehydratase family protein [Campylobacterales bacterium]